MPRQLFPILPEDRRTIKGCPDFILWKHIAPHEAQAWDNHGQTLERLAQRGGLSLQELWAVMHDVGIFDTFGWGSARKPGAPTLDECLAFALTLTGSEVTEPGAKQ
jgi:hypothetical protein